MPRPGNAKRLIGLLRLCGFRGSTELTQLQGWILVATQRNMTQPVRSRIFCTLWYNMVQQTTNWFHLSLLHLTNPTKFRSSDWFRLSLARDGCLTCLTDLYWSVRSVYQKQDCRECCKSLEGPAPACWVWVPPNRFLSQQGCKMLQVTAHSKSMNCRSGIQSFRIFRIFKRLMRLAVLTLFYIGDLSDWWDYSKDGCEEKATEPPCHGSEDVPNAAERCLQKRLRLKRAAKDQECCPYPGSQP